MLHGYFRLYFDRHVRFVFDIIHSTIRYCVVRLKFAAWSHHRGEVDLGLTTDKGDLSRCDTMSWCNVLLLFSYMNNSEFDLLEMKAIRQIVRFPSCSELQWPMIVIRIQMTRRPLFYVFNHVRVYNWKWPRCQLNSLQILPCCLISSMAVLGFWVPPDTGEKITMHVFL
jgi:nicotinic acetylcholine receptor